MDKLVHRFGLAHLEDVIMLDAISGGSGFYGDPITRQLADSFGFGEKYLIDNSDMYTDPRTAEIRNLSEKGEDTTELRREFAEDIRSNEKIAVLREIAKDIGSSYQRRVRLDQANSLRVVNGVLLDDLRVRTSDISYRDALIGITGVEPALVPGDFFMQDQKDRTLELMGYPKNTSMREAAIKWRKDMEILNREETGELYKKSCTLMFDILKQKYLPKDAELKVDILEDAPFMGFFAYGNRQGDVYGETCMVKSDTKCAFDIINTATHEIGGHYLVTALWHEYARESDDVFGATNTMATNQACVNEGYANCAKDLFDLSYLFENVGFGLEKMDSEDIRKNLAISSNLETLAMMSLGYEAHKLFELGNITPNEMVKEYEEFGVDSDRAELRVKHMCGPDAKKLHSFCYFGPGYFPGMVTVNGVLKYKGRKEALDAITTKEGPCSLYTLRGKIPDTRHGGIISI